MNCKNCKTNCTERGKDKEESNCRAFHAQTNADRIRTMSDEEIAEFFWRDPARIYFKTPKETLDWLKQEAGE